MTQWLTQITFSAPAALWALAALPLIYWLLRTSPPAPKEVRFPPFALLRSLIDRRRQPARTPWWLLLLRMALALFLVLALAGPQVVPRRHLPLSGTGPVLLIVDDGWAAARRWPAVRRLLRAALMDAMRADKSVIVATTTPRLAPIALVPLTPASWLRRVEGLKPQALEPDRGALLKRLRKLRPRPSRIVWFADGLDYGHAAAFLRALRATGAPLIAHVPKAAHLALALRPPRNTRDGLEIRVVRALAGGPESVPVILRDAAGRPLAQTDVRFAPAATLGEGRLRLPTPLRNQATRLKIAGQHHAAAVWLLGDDYKRKTALVLSGRREERAQPLLSDTYYLKHALAPFAEVRTETDPGAIGEWLRAGLSLLVLADVGRLPPAIERDLLAWVRAGGVVLRFAGERLSNADSALLPVKLRRQPRRLGATLGWQRPQPLAAFAPGSPFAGLAPDPQVKVRRQVLAEPDAELPARTWASLADGTPLVTAKRLGRGLLVLVHVTASPQWSNLPLSGLFVRMMERIVTEAPLARPFAATRAKAAAPAATEKRSRAAAQQGAFVPVSMLDGEGVLQPMPPHVLPVRAPSLTRLRPSPAHPAGIYARGAQRRALNVGHERLTLTPLPALPAGVVRAGYAAATTRDLAPPLLKLAAALFVLDLLAMVGILGGLSFRRPRAALLVALALLPLLAGAASAQGAETPEERARLAFAMRMARNIHLAHVKSGEREVDDIAHAGLVGLSEALFARTSVEPDEPVAIDIERDDISVFSFLYWPVTAKAPAPSEKAVKKLRTFLRYGGTILFDTRDAPDAALSPDHMTPERRALRRILAKLDIPPLEPVPRTHVLGRSFYLLKDFPGRFDQSRLWVESTSIGRERERLSPANADGVSAVLITGNDMAGAWAVSGDGRPLLPVLPGGARQREYAFRAGINIVIYVLTGNYKADQVHLPAILQRLGQ